MTEIVLMKAGHALVPHDEAAKCCTKCGRTQPPEAFAKCRKSRDGRQPQCKLCDAAYQAAYRAAHKEELQAYSAAYVARTKQKKAEYDQKNYEANVIQIKARTAEWATANQVKVRSYAVKYYARNRSKAVARAMAWNQRNRQVVNARIAAWRRANPDAYRTYSAQRRARIRGADGNFSAKEIRALFTKQKGRCACCRKSIKSKFHADHIDALVRGGGNSIRNIQLLCPACNLEKAAKHPVDFMRSKGFLL